MKRIEGESELAYFLRGVERARRAFRDKGLEFWDCYPNDPRRYKWLALTVGMPPRYPKDLFQWAANETRLAPNGSEVDRATLADWERRYPKMREAFWFAPSIADDDRRTLWFWELKQKLLRMREASARGESVNGSGIIDEAMAFLKTYPRPFSEDDERGFYDNAQALIEYIVHENRSEFGFDNEAFLQLADRLKRTRNISANYFSERIRASIAQEGKFPLPAPDGRGPIPPDASAAEIKWRTLPQFPLDAGRSPERMMVFWHDQLVQTRKHRAMGMDFWRKYPDHQRQYVWLFTTLNNDVLYPVNFLSAVRELAQGNGMTVNFGQDWQARRTDERRYQQLRAEFWADPKTTQAERSFIRSMELQSKGIEIQRFGWNRRNHPKEIASFLNDVQGYYDEYHTPDNRNHTRLLSDLMQNYRELGMSGDELIAFFAPFRHYNSEELREMAKAAARTVALAETPFELKAPTMAGKPFDIASLRGKVVLVDHWDTACSACINAMPRIHKIYRKYKGKGFEVVSVAYDGKASRRKVLRVEKEMDLTWTTLAADGLWEDISKRYGYSGVPQYMLLDRKGKLIAGTAEVDMGRNLEALLKEHL